MHQFLKIPRLLPAAVNPPAVCRGLKGHPLDVLGPRLKIIECRRRPDGITEGRVGCDVGNYRAIDITARPSRSDVRCSAPFLLSIVRSLSLSPKVTMSPSCTMCKFTPAGRELEIHQIFFVARSTRVLRRSIRRRRRTGLIAAGCGIVLGRGRQQALGTQEAEC
jgi:hypothetical protein